MMKRFSLVLALALLAAPQMSCSSRTSAATQTTPVAFAPEQSDAKAIELVDAMSAKLGGPAAWEAMKQVRFDMKYTLNGELKGWFKHSWDRWNGRHRYEVVDMTTVAKAEAEGNPALVKSLVVGYNLFNRGRGFVTYGGQAADSDTKKKRIEEAYVRWQDDVYKLVFLHKLKDPGVVLKYKEKVKDQSGLCNPSCELIEVTFTDGVGDDKYYLNIDEGSGLPVVWQKTIKDASGNEGRLGFKLEGWVEAGGLKFATVLQNLGVAGERFTFENVAVGSPDDSLYIPQIR